MKILRVVLVFIFISVFALTVFSPKAANAGGAVDAVSSVVGGITEVASAVVSVLNTGANLTLGIVEKFVGEITGINFLTQDGECRLDNTNNAFVEVYAGKCGGGGGAGTGAAGAGSGGVVLVPTNNNACAFQIPITFYNPYMNFSEGGPTQVGYETNCRYDNDDDWICDFAQIADGERYSDSSCSTSDINGMYGMVNGSCQQLIVSVGNCSWASPDSTIDETTRKVAIYRLTLPVSASQREIDLWFADTIRGSVGNGFELYEQWEGHWPYGVYNNAADSQPIAIVNYLDFCPSGNTCYFTDNAAPNDSYVAYVAKVLGPYSMSSGSGHSCDTTGWNKYINTNNTNFATFPTWDKTDPDDPQYKNRITSLGNIIAGPYKTATAVCAPSNYTLSVSKSGSGAGTIGSNLSGINNCSGSCSTVANSGTAVTLSVSVDAGSTFAGWSGACSGTGACSVTMDSDKSVTAEFSRTKPTLLFTSWPTFELPQLVSLYWNSTNADSCNASGDWSGNKAVNGEEKISKSRGNYSFTLACSNSGGSVSDTKNIRVIDVPSCSFSASPNSVIPPQASMLSWNCSGVSGGCSIDNGIGDKTASGSVRVNPANTTTYSLTCSGADGNRSFQTTINSGFIQIIKEIIPKW